MRRLIQALPLALVFLALLSAPASAINQIWTGTLGAAPAGAKEGVVATLAFKEGDKDVTMNLLADGDVAKNLKEWAAKSQKAKIAGSKVDDANIKVSTAEKAE